MGLLSGLLLLRRPGQLVPAGRYVLAVGRLQELVLAFVVVRTVVVLSFVKTIGPEKAVKIILLSKLLQKETHVQCSNVSSTTCSLKKCVALVKTTCRLQLDLSQCSCFEISFKQSYHQMRGFIVRNYVCIIKLSTSIP